jgi:ABC-type Fe3+ transport system substrate-binding protein
MDEVILDDAAITLNWFLSVPKNSAKPSLAKLFIGFVTTPEGQKILQDYAYASSALVQGTAAYKQTREIEASGARVLSMLPDEIIARQKELDGYREEYQRILRTKN